MEKQYGLILPGQQKKIVPPVREIRRPAIFDESSNSTESEDDVNAPKAPLKSKIGGASLGPGATALRLSERMQKKALEEDPTVFQYDELYEEMENKRQEEKQTKAMEPKKPKYINKLLETAERRKLEYELRIERQVQKEREAEGEQFKDKESFVTSAYRKKLEEMRKLQENEERDDYLEAIGDVTKQKDLDGFYRHLYEQKTGTSKEIVKPELSNEEVKYTPIKSGRPPQQQQQRAYRKRQSSEDDDDDNKPSGSSAQGAEANKKVHLANNIDADSDFSIDSSSSSSDSSDAEDEELKTKNNNKDSRKETQLNVDTSKTAPKLEKMKKDADEVNVTKDKQSDDKKEKKKEENTIKDSPPRPRKEKVDIWKKRTVGEVFEAALHRYYERKAARRA